MHVFLVILFYICFPRREVIVVKAGLEPTTSSHIKSNPPVFAITEVFVYQVDVVLGTQLNQPVRGMTSSINFFCLHVIIQDFFLAILANP